MQADIALAVDECQRNLVGQATPGMVGKFDSLTQLEKVLEK